jgi:RNA polymerase sigma factor (sigma-70 family)
MTRKGGTAPFEEIVRRHRASLLAFASTVAPPSRAEDVVQDSLLKAYAALQEGAEPEALRAWLFRIVRNTAIDERRGVRHHEQLDENYDGVEQPPQALDRRERTAALVASIRDLPAAQREAIVKRELEGRGHEEIGRALELSPGAVRQLIYRARHRLREAAGAMIPAAVVRAASLPGADQAAGGLGIAGALKLGIAAVVATGSIVAGVSIGRHDATGTADALRLSPHGSDSRTAAPGVAGGDPTGDSRHGDRSGSSGPGSGRDGGHSGDGESRSGDGLSGGNSGPGGDSGSSGSGSSGSGDGISGSSGSGDGGSGTSGSGSGDTITTTSSDDGSGGTSGGSGSGDLLDPLSGGSSGPG